MKNANWESVLGQINEEFVQEALESYHHTGKIRSLPRKILFLAAAIALFFTLGLTAYAANWFGVRDMLMELSGGTYITIAGYQDSSEYKALMEWEACRPKSLRIKGPVVEDKLYNQYGAYTPEVKKSLDAILEKYGLQPHDEWTSVYDRDPQSLYDAVGVDGFLPESCAGYRGTIDPDIPGCSVRNGCSILSFTDTTLLSDGTQVNYDFTNWAKGYMPIFMGIEIDTESVTEWYYTTKDGTKLLLCTDADSSILLADLPNSFLSIGASVTVTPGKYAPLTKEALEEFADLFSYKTIAEIG